MAAPDEIPIVAVNDIDIRIAINDDKFLMFDIVFTFSWLFFYSESGHFQCSLGYLHVSMDLPYPGMNNGW